MAAAANRGSKLYRGYSSQSFLQLFRDFGRLATSRPQEFLSERRELYGRQAAKERQSRDRSRATLNRTNDFFESLGLVTGRLMEVQLHFTFINRVEKQNELFFEMDGVYLLQRKRTQNTEHSGKFKKLYTVPVVQKVNIQFKFI